MQTGIPFKKLSPLTPPLKDRIEMPVEKGVIASPQGKPKRPQEMGIETKMIKPLTTQGTICSNPKRESQPDTPTWWNHEIMWWNHKILHRNLDLLKH